MGKLEDDLEEAGTKADYAETIKRVIKHLKDKSLPKKLADTTNKVDKERELHDLEKRTKQEIQWKTLPEELSVVADTPLNSERSNPFAFTSEEEKKFERPLHKEGADLTDIEAKVKSTVYEIDAKKADKEEKLNKLIGSMGARDLDDDPTMGE